MRDLRSEEKSDVKNNVGRLVFVVISVLLQVTWLIIVFLYLNNYSTWISLASSIVALLMALWIYHKPTNAAFKMPWIILILALPVVGICFYGIFGNANATRKERRIYAEIDEFVQPLLMQDDKVMEELHDTDKAICNQFRYVKDYGRYPVCKNTDVTYYKDADLAYDAQLEDLAQAKEFIFLEYHAFEEAESFWRMKKILKERAAAGVEIRLLYDEVGCIGFIDRSFIDRMEAIGVQCMVFNPVMPFANIFMNNRDHRKITVIDGQVGYTGGYNIANEYFNITSPYGYWKDTGIRLEGDAVVNLTVTFLQMWNAMGQISSKRKNKFVGEITLEDYKKYLPEITYQAKEDSFVQPYADTPLDGEYVGESVYLNIIKNAKDYVYFTTPYLVITDEMNRELGLAAKRGVDVRIMTPGIPDKKIIYQVTRSYYGRLVDQGVRVYEYTPGFLHAKMCICDDEVCTVGTINLDYRSFYHHFENGVLMYRTPIFSEIYADIQEIMEVSEEVTEKYKNHPRPMKVGYSMLRLLAPLF